jgi:hypothetical protein
MTTMRAARREACFITALLLESYADVGQPFEACRAGNRRGHHRMDDETCPDCDRLAAALRRLRDELTRRS